MSTKVNNKHFIFLSKDQLIAKIKRNPKVDHMKSDAVYETTR